MSERTAHERMVAHLMAALSHLEAHRAAASDAVVAHLAEHPVPPAPSPPITEG